MQQWIIGILGSMGAIVMASAVAWAGADQGALYDGVSVFVWCGVFAFSVQWLIFIHAWFAQTEHFFDLTGSLTYMVLVLAACYLSEAFDVRSLVIVGLVLIWALRLGPFLFSVSRRLGKIGASAVSKCPFRRSS